MTDEQIIKALERCFIVGSCSGCAGCPLKPKRQEDANCIDKLVTNTIDLIKRQQAEIEMLKAEQPTGINELLVIVEDDIRAEAIKEFAHKLKVNRPKLNTGEQVFYIRPEEVDELVKEMGCGE